MIQNAFDISLSLDQGVKCPKCEVDGLGSDSKENNEVKETTKILQQSNDLLFVVKRYKQNNLFKKPAFILIENTKWNYGKSGDGKTGARHYPSNPHPRVWAFYGDQSIPVILNRVDCWVKRKMDKTAKMTKMTKLQQDEQRNAKVSSSPWRIMTAIDTIPQYALSLVHGPFHTTITIPYTYSTDLRSCRNSRDHYRATVTKLAYNHNV